MAGSASPCSEERGAARDASAGAVAAATTADVVAMSHGAVGVKAEQTMTSAAAEPAVTNSKPVPWAVQSAEPAPAFGVGGPLASPALHSSYSDESAFAQLDEPEDREGPAYDWGEYSDSDDDWRSLFSSDGSSCEDSDSDSDVDSMAANAEPAFHTDFQSVPHVPWRWHDSSSYELRSQEFESHDFRSQDLGSQTFASLEFELSGSVSDVGSPIAGKRFRSAVPCEECGKQQWRCYCPGSLEVS
ncbi:hypothetical protein JKP88DRAFT_247115 [Tribonema minus]|uniref:Uncharacterized protein n=1 Tax=Tribonema minus TaxID=303371 RepID=A0A835YR59_9STRA|nr:hypothetical protein JKP88DRAFT_247115 [Tribonema minus]